MRESVGMLKEKLLIQGKEVQRLNAEKAKHDAKIQHVLTISNQKIEDLKTTISEKEEEAKNFQNSEKEGADTSFSEF